MTPAADAVERFAADLSALGPVEGGIGIAVSGGPDSLALLLLAHAALGDRCRAATVDHRLRAEAAAEAASVATICASLGVPHDTLVAQWDNPPTANLQARAREARYELLGKWARDQRLGAVLTAHHTDDQAETLLMRLARGSGVAGLAGARASRPLAEGVRLLRPLLGWRKADLAALVEAAGIGAFDDPTNHDPRHDRSRTRAWLAEADWADPVRLAVSAAALREADEALDWALASLKADRIVSDGDALTVDPANLPREFQRRLLLAAFASLGAPTPRGPDLTRARAALAAGATITLSGLKLVGGERWRLGREGARRA